MDFGPESKIKLIVGLGNPGKNYAFTRHNIGYRVVDALEEDKPDGILLFKPSVFMNGSGAPVAELIRRKGWTPGELLVICDDFSIPMGTMRIRLKGSSGGHNGLDSILQALGTLEVPRLRVGIGPVDEGRDPADFVLEIFRSKEKSTAVEMVEKAAEASRVIVTAGLATAMNRFNQKNSEKGPGL